ncbi:MAG: hypothetical protein OXC40_03430 [Proteobacteria bacterium]|nr:hypothetical protein [Pseudomonadota bacterium]
MVACCVHSENSCFGLPYWCWSSVAVMILACLVSCKHPSHQSDPVDQLEITSLNSLATEKYSLYLTYGPRPNTYEFVTCDASVPLGVEKTCGAEGEESSCFLEHQKPEHCVSSFLSTPGESLCVIYEVLRKRCPTLGEFKKYCAADSPSDVHLPTGYSSRHECTMVSVLENSCPVIPDAMKHSCEQTYQAHLQCDNGESCDQYELLKKKRAPLLLTSSKLYMGEAQSLALAQHLKYERYLVTQKNRSSKVFHGIGTGSFFASIFSPRSLTMFNRVVPKRLSKDLFKVPVVNKTLNTKHLISVTGSGAVFNTIRDQQKSDFLADINSFLPANYCQEMIRQQIEVPTTIMDNKEGLDFLIDWFPGVMLGAGGNVIILKATSESHPAVKYGAFVVLPFISFYLANKLQDSSPGVIEKEYASLFTPKQLSRHESQELRKTSAHMADILGVLGRSMIFTYKATSQSIDQYCLPRKDGNNYVSECFPLFSGDEGSLYEAEFGGFDETGVDVCARYR